MSTDEYSTEMELYGVSPGVIAIIMFVVTSVVPCGYVPSGIDVIGYLWAGPFAYSLLWVLFFPTGFHGFALGFLFPELLIVTFPLCILNIAYARWIVRVYQDKSTKYTALVTGLLSILLPTAIVLYVGGLFG
ncbi:MAG: hypothetical protein ACFFBL_13235, partial [Promethearchaeota archaeon]